MKVDLITMGQACF